jgi:hypothetical protein
MPLITCVMNGTLIILEDHLVSDMFEPIVVVGKDGLNYRIPLPALEDWNSWIDMSGDKWVPPIYAKEDVCPTNRYVG